VISLFLVLLLLDTSYSTCDVIVIYRCKLEHMIRNEIINRNWPFLQKKNVNISLATLSGNRTYV